MVPAAIMSPDGVAVCRYGVAHLKIFFGLVTAPFLGQWIEVALAGQVDVFYEWARLGLLKPVQTVACPKLEDIVRACPEKHSRKFETWVYVKEECLGRIRKASAAGRK